MDPLSITASVVGIGSTVATVVKGLKEIADKVKLSNITLLSYLLRIKLGQLETVFRRHGDEIIPRFEQQPALASAFDTTFEGCALLYDHLENEVQDIRAKMRSDGALDWSSKFRMAWKQDDMELLVGQIRGQGAALNLLLQGLQTDSLFELQKMLRSQGDTMTKVQATTKSLRQKYPDSEVPESILGASKTAESIFGGTSTVGDGTEFSFDDIIVNSKAYRRAMALAEAQIRGKAQLDVERIPGVDQEGVSSENADARISISADTDGADSGGSVEHPAAIAESEAQEARPLGPLRRWKDPLPLQFSDADEGRWNRWMLPDWATAFDLRLEDVRKVSRQRLELHNVHWEIFTSEYAFIAAGRNFVRLYRSQFLKSSPVASGRQELFQSLFDGLDNMMKLHEKLIYQPLWNLWDSNGAFARFSAEPFLDTLANGREASGRYFYQFPLVRRLVQLESRYNSTYDSMLEILRNDRACHRLSWDHHAKVPITRLQRYSVLINTLAKQAQRVGRQDIYDEAQRAYMPLKSALTSWDDSLRAGERASKNEVTLLQFDAESKMQLSIRADQPSDQIVARASLPCRLKAGESWSYLQVVLQEGELVMARAREQGSTSQRSSRLSWRSSERTPKSESDDEVLDRTPLGSLHLIARLELQKASCKMNIEPAVKLGTFSHGRGELPSGIMIYPLSFKDGKTTCSIAFLGDGRTGVKVRDNYYREDWYDLIAAVLEGHKAQ